MYYGGEIVMKTASSKKHIRKATIFYARIAQIVARISMIILSIVGSVSSSILVFSLAEVSRDFRFFLFFIMQILILVFLTGYSFFNELAGSACWILYCLLTFFYLHFRFPYQLTGLWINYTILIGGVIVGLLLFFTWYVEWNDPLYKILRKVENKSFDDY
jgi:hypothetical protein